MVKKRVVGIFGSFGWAGGAVKAMTEFVKNSGLELVEPAVEAQFAPDAGEIEQCRQLGRNMARYIRENST
jgi:flavorubredoxin